MADESNLMNETRKNTFHTGSSLNDEPGTPTLNEPHFNETTRDKMVERSAKDTDTQANFDIGEADYDTLKRDLDKIRQDVALLVTDFTERKNHLVKNLTEDLLKESKSLLESAKNRSKTLAKSAGDTAKQSTIQLEETIQRKPIISMVISFLVGVFMAKLLNKD